MKKTLQFNLKYFIIAIAIFLTEILIATKLKNVFFVRAYLGDVFVVMLIYYFTKAFINFEHVKLITGIFIFSCLIEILQYFHFGELLGFKDHRIMMIILGNSFSWIDILCYFAGCVMLYFKESKSYHPKVS